MPVLTKQDFRTQIAQSGRLLGVDVGSKRIGLALSNSNRTVATPYQSYPRGKWVTDAPYFQHLAQTYAIVGVVVGLPLTLPGAHGKAADAAASYADLLQQALPALPVMLWDERFTTTAAQHSLFENREAKSRQTRASKKATVGRIDPTAAAILLQTVCDWLQTGTA